MAKRITLKEVALQAGVSYQTVSKVMNSQIQVSKNTEDRIWEAVRSLGYRPNQVARSLRSQKTRLIGYSWEPTRPDQINPVLEKLLQSMIQAAEEAQYHILAFPYRQGSQWVDLYRELIETNRVDGFVLSSVEYNDPRIALLQEREFPFVAFGRSNPEWTFPYVDVDGGEGMYQAVNHLVKSGHRRIFVLAWPEESRVGQNRMSGVQSAFKEAGIVPQPDWVASGEGTYEFGYEMTGRWLSQPQENWPTAIVAFNDNMAIGAINAAKNHGLQVGKDLVVTGFDDSPISQYMTPPLTTIRQPIWDIGQRIIAMLLAVIDEHQPAEREVLVQPQLIIRESSLKRIE